MRIDRVEIADEDFKNVNIWSIAAVLVIIALSFRSLSVPVLLVASIEAAIAINMGIPYFVTGAPDQGHDTVESVHIEMRDPNFTHQAMGVRTACDGVKGYYPAFDVTPPHLVSGVVTDRGIYAPYDLHRYFADGNDGEYTDKDLCI